MDQLRSVAVSACRGLSAIAGEAPSQPRSSVRPPIRMERSPALATDRPTSVHDKIMTSQLSIDPPVASDETMQCENGWSENTPRMDAKTLDPPASSRPDFK